MSKNVWFLEHANIIPDTHLNRSKLHLNQKGTTLLDSNFIHVFERIWLENKDEVTKANATILERYSDIKTDGRSDNLLDKNESKAFSMAF